MITFSGPVMIEAGYDVFAVETWDFFWLFGEEGEENRDGERVFIVTLLSHDLCYARMSVCLACSDV